MNKGPGTYHFPPMKRGDTFRSRAIATITQDGVALAVSSARMQVRPAGGGEVLIEWDSEADTPSITIGGAGSNVVTLAEKTAAEMADIAPGTHEYDLEVVFAASSVTLTILGGRFPILADVTRTTV